MGNSFRRRVAPFEFDKKCEAANASSYSMYETYDGKYQSTFKCSEEFEVGSVPRPCGVYEPYDCKPRPVPRPVPGPVPRPVPMPVLRRSDRALKINIHALRYT